MIHSDSYSEEIRRWYPCGKPKDYYMRVQDNVKHAVCFLCVSYGGDNYKPFGTAFFFAVPHADEADRYHYYIATAKHNLDKFEELENSAIKSRGIHMRVNTTEGKFIHKPIEGVWVKPKGTSTADVAIIPMNDPPPSLEIDAITLEYSVTQALMSEITGVDERIKHMSLMMNRPLVDSSVPIGIGDDVLAVGLFTRREGTSRNIPIVRAGIIAAMPEESVYDAEAKELFNGYLVEMRSISGLSGSPVFVSLPRFRVNKKGEGRLLYFLGLIRGHWSERVEILVADDKPITNKKGKQKKRELEADVFKFNTGIAALTPAQELINLLEEDSLVKLRGEREKKSLGERSKGFEADSALDGIRKAEQGEYLTPEGFQDALKKVFPKPSQSASKKKRT